MTCGLLPVIDKNVLLFERWLHTHLAGINNAGQAQIVRRFATWEVLPRLRARTDRKPLTQGSRKLPGDQVKRATAFLAWLAARGRDLGECRQADIDDWYVEHGIHDRTTIRAFLQWCAKNKLTRRFNLPVRQITQAKPLSHQHRVALLGQVLTDDQVPLRVRVAATLVLLYAQPVSRIVRLTLDDVIEEDGQILVRLGEPPSPMPEPFSDLLHAYIACRDTVHGAHVHDSTWLFPGRRAGQPLHHSYLAELINQIGVPTSAARAAAVRQHVLETPAPVVADALGYHPRDHHPARRPGGRHLESLHLR